jgi:hypothetical protein
MVILRHSNLELREHFVGCITICSPAVHFFPSCNRQWRFSTTCGFSLHNVDKLQLILDSNFLSFKWRFCFISNLYFVQSGNAFIFLSIFLLSYLLYIYYSLSLDLLSCFPYIYYPTFLTLIILYSLHLLPYFPYTYYPVFLIFIILLSLHLLS